MKANVPFKLTTIVSLIILAEANVWADVLPGAAQPEQVSRALSTQRPQQQVGEVPSVVNPEEKTTSPLGEAAKKIKFQLNGIILKGNHVFTDAELRPLYQSKLHKTITVAELFDIVQGITNFYRNNGYIISRAILPPQHVKNGVVTVQIIEGYIGKVSVGGYPRRSEGLVQAYGEKIRENPPLRISRMEKYLLLANQIPGTEVKAVLSPSKTHQGAADLTLITQNRPITSYFSYDNYGTRYIGPQQMTGNLGLNSFFTAGDATQLTITRTPKGGELNYTDLNYSFPVNAEGVRWLFGGTRAHTHPLFVLQPAQVDGINDNYYTNLTYPLILTRSESLNFIGSFNYNDSNVTTFDQQLYTDHLRSLGLGLNWSFADRYYGANTLYGDIRQGLPILGYSSDYNPDTAQTSRPGGRGDYTKIDAQVSRLQAIWGPISAYGLIKGQWAFNPLLSAEQFTFGGSQLGRGYDVAELIGDKGLAGSLELRYDQGIDMFYLSSLQFYTFYDAGEIWNFKDIGGVPRKVNATSTGLGVRFFGTQYVSGNLMWTQTLTKQVAAEELIGDGRRPRVFFSLVTAFG